LDAHKFGRTLAAIGLVAGPLLFGLDAAIDPAWASDDAAYLAEVDANRGVYLAAELCSTFGALLLIAGMIGVMLVARGPRVNLVQVAAGIVAIGFIGLAGSLAFSIFDLAMADFADRGAMAALRAELQDSAPYRAFWLVFSALATVGGLLLFSAALFARSAVPRWAPIAIAAAALLWYTRGGDQTAFVATWALLAAGFAPLAAAVRSGQLRVN
jgi:hypothetical protein